MNIAIDLNGVEDPSSLPETAVLEAYKNAMTYCNEQTETIEKYKQKIYGLEQEKTLKDSVQQDELQVLTENFDRELENIKRKFSVENECLCNRLTELNLNIEKLELENEQLKFELESVTKKSQAVQAIENKSYKENEIVVSKSHIEHLERLEADYVILIDDKANLKDELFRLTSELSQKSVIYLYIVYKIS